MCWLVAPRTACLRDGNKRANQVEIRCFAVGVCRSEAVQRLVLLNCSAIGGRLGIGQNGGCGGGVGIGTNIACIAWPDFKHSRDNFRSCHGGIIHEGRPTILKPVSSFSCYMSNSVCSMDWATPSFAVQSMVCAAATGDPAQRLHSFPSLCRSMATDV